MSTNPTTAADKRARIVNMTRCALCSIVTHSLAESAAPLTKGVVCGDCWPHVQRYRLRRAPAAIVVIREGTSYSVTEDELSDSDFENTVWTNILDVGSVE